MPNHNTLRIRISISGAGTGGAHATNFMRTAGYRDVDLAIIDTGRATQYQWKLPQHIQAESLPPVTWFSAPVGGRLNLDAPDFLITLLKNSHAVFISALQTDSSCNWTRFVRGGKPSAPSSLLSVCSGFANRDCYITAAMPMNTGCGTAVILTPPEFMVIHRL